MFWGTELSKPLLKSRHLIFKNRASDRETLNQLRQHPPQPQWSDNHTSAWDIWHTKSNCRGFFFSAGQCYTRLQLIYYIIFIEKLISLFECLFESLSPLLLTPKYLLTYAYHAMIYSLVCIVKNITQIRANFTEWRQSKYMWWHWLISLISKYWFSIFISCVYFPWRGLKIALGVFSEVETL